MGEVIIAIVDFHNSRSDFVGFSSEKVMIESACAVRLSLDGLTVVPSHSSTCERK